MPRLKKLPLRLRKLLLLKQLRLRKLLLLKPLRLKKLLLSQLPRHQKPSQLPRLKKLSQLPRKKKPRSNSGLFEKARFGGFFYA